MTTLKKSTEYTSITLMSGKECTARIEPSEEKGVRYHYNGTVIEATLENVISTDHCVVLGNGKEKITLTEHLNAACAVCGLDALDIYLSHNEVPIGDGSSKHWVELFKKAGITGKNKDKFVVTEPVYYLNEKTHCVILPSDKLRITYAVSYKHPDLKQRWVSFDGKNLEEIIEARTFGFLKELKLYQLAGFARGAQLDNTVGLKDEGYTVPLRSELEPVKHKILDLIGDFYLSGTNPLDLKAEIIVKEAGHAVHVKTAKMLKDKISKE